MARRIYLQSLGCPKNLVDSEQMLGLAARAGAEIVLDPADADVLVVNTCGFIGEAKKESIEAILELAQLKQSAPGKRLIVTGCLVQRYGSELAQALPEVDGFLGTGDFTRLPELLDAPGTADLSAYRHAAHLLPSIDVPRARTGHFFSAYLKISEGCDHRCSFCIIPKIRGRHESKTLDGVIAEAEALVRDGVVELNLIAQDLTAYGKDRRDGSSLSSLLQRLAAIDGLRWIRLLYTYPRYVTDELLDTIANEPKICRYIDMPLQHISDTMLTRMRRERSGDAVRRLVSRMRARVPGLALRTSFIVGFPGETDADFAELEAFIPAARFDNVGVFRYSREEGTEAATLDQQVSARVKQQRYHRLMTAQAGVAAALNRERVGSVQPVLVCGTNTAGRWYGRSPAQAPDIDGVVYLDGADTPGAIVDTTIVDATIYDLEGCRATPVDSAGDCL
ncbi:MAG: 30S ribosomal protein S12 methylthiotransferase RimO [Deltaproteobacteria bacterium]|nr:30S ribosomal protein S12 methylthiotransferase RimO [Deltaproteobacteria bacterium]MBI3388040.1 30S ribosomal protein S12 methylthiotransferase RimO [Deltaproteobacteria bacterium]